MQSKTGVPDYRKWDLARGISPYHKPFLPVQNGKRDACSSKEPPVHTICLIQQCFNLTIGGSRSRDLKYSSGFRNCWTEESSSLISEHDSLLAPGCTSPAAQHQNQLKVDTPQVLYVDILHSRVLRDFLLFFSLTPPQLKLQQHIPIGRLLEEIWFCVRAEGNSSQPIWSELSSRRKQLIITIQATLELTITPLLQEHENRRTWNRYWAELHVDNPLHSWLPANPCWKYWCCVEFELNVPCASSTGCLRLRRKISIERIFLHSVSIWAETFVLRKTSSIMLMHWTQPQKGQRLLLLDSNGRTMAHRYIARNGGGRHYCCVPLPFPSPEGPKQCLRKLLRLGDRNIRHIVFRTYYRKNRPQSQ